MKIEVGSFYAGESRFDEYITYIRASKKALKLTNPDAKFTIITDVETSYLFNPNEFDLFVSPSDLPLMLKIIWGQILFIEQSEADLIILPDVDCLANKKLDESIPENVGLAITHKGPKFHYRINNVAYIRDKKLGVWFLQRSFDILLKWPREKHEWWGDQEAWQSALGVEINGLGYYVVVERIKDEILVAQPEKDKIIHLYPCQTHNCPMPDDGEIRENQKNAYLIHFKGPRKDHIKKWMKERFGEE